MLRRAIRFAALTQFQSLLSWKSPIFDTADGFSLRLTHDSVSILVVVEVALFDIGLAPDRGQA